MTLFYSNRCKFSQQFINELKSHDDINSSIQLVNIDNPNIDLPPFIRSVPSMIIENNLISGKSLFEWLKSKKQENDLLPPACEPGSECEFSFISGDEAGMSTKNSPFTFIANNDCATIQAPQEESRKQNNLADRMEMLQKEREGQLPAFQQRI
tara:strand:+ start:1099 stop:1557 length:459 start_codon:yes stop_codon:yes gene_type:complete